MHNNLRNNLYWVVQNGPSVRLKVRRTLAGRHILLHIFDVQLLYSQSWLFEYSLYKEEEYDFKLIILQDLYCFLFVVVCLLFLLVLSN